MAEIKLLMTNFFFCNWNTIYIKSERLNYKFIQFCLIDLVTQYLKKFKLNLRCKRVRKLRNVFAPAAGIINYGSVYRQEYSLYIRLSTRHVLEELV